MLMINKGPLKNVTKLTYVGPAVWTGRNVAVILHEKGNGEITWQVKCLHHAK